MSERARKAAAAADLGAWERSLRVNGSVDRNDLIVSTMLVFVVPWLPIFTGLTGELWGMGGLCIGIGVIFLCAGIFFFRDAWRRWRAGEALVHLFAEGAVLERTKGALFALPYAETPAEHVTWMESQDGSDSVQPRVHFLIPLPEGSSVTLDAQKDGELLDLSSLAERWGFSTEPRLLEKQPKANRLW